MSLLDVLIALFWMNLLTFRINTFEKIITHLYFKGGYLMTFYLTIMFNGFIKVLKNVLLKTTKDRYTPIKLHWLYYELKGLCVPTTTDRISTTIMIRSYNHCQLIVASSWNNESIRSLIKTHYCLMTQMFSWPLWWFTI